MAQRVQIVLTDDLDGSEAAESVSFALDGKSYEIDLSTSNAASLRDAMAPYLAKARPASGSSRRGGGRRGGGRSSSGGGAAASANEIRAWAREQGMEVSERGRVRADVLRAYEEAHR